MNSHSLCIRDIYKESVTEMPFREITSFMNAASVSFIATALCICSSIQIFPGLMLVLPGNKFLEYSQCTTYAFEFSTLKLRQWSKLWLILGFLYNLCFVLFSLLRLEITCVNGKKQLKPAVFPVSMVQHIATYLTQMNLAH